MEASKFSIEQRSLKRERFCVSSYLLINFRDFFIRAEHQLQSATPGGPDDFLNGSDHADVGHVPRSLQGRNDDSSK